ncbi:ATP-dependent protease ATPase subunit HslU [candidate division NPL-UPA2 bacterium Unc8]|uniref:ATP-dependent protease ATPase subunit HslU n=1 Tax=candidate division NPL-UPA2 bacterium Unc8 TaxID=1980939 RepID=A0A399FVG9_UNCN2|nr:MAG: ATP-dependent protease ATPase subunit HslU [candidate division NPL-UPA2 bacterium Unc8]
MDALTPKEIVRELDKYIIGQDEAKKSVAIALRNRWRRQQLPPELRDEVAPKNIIMIGPTGIGKTEIARRLARLTYAPFIKVEASKYTEVGYVGRDVESMVRELTALSVNIVRKEKTEFVSTQAKAATEERILDLLLPPVDVKSTEGSIEDGPQGERTREKLRQQLHNGKLEERIVTIEAQDRFTPMFEVFSGPGLEQMDINIHEMFGKMFPQETKRRKATIREARKIIFQEEVQKLVNMDEVIREAIIRVESSGIIFIDELDKIAGRETSKGPDVSREGVQRDLLPIIEGTTVATKHGMVKTDHILFIAAGAFHVAKPSDLIPEMQGRFPIRVELKSLSQQAFEKILTQPENSLVKQYCALLATEGVKIKFLRGAIKEIASIASLANKRMENIGARRLYTIMEKTLEDISFAATDAPAVIEINADYVKEKLAGIIKDEDASKYIL